jgi:3-hydroxybutyryl-CoA dehydratase
MLCSFKGDPSTEADRVTRKHVLESRRGDALADRPDAIQFSKTITETDVYLFAGVTGDFSPVHLNAEYAARAQIGERVAHGVLVIGLMSAVSSLWCARENIDALSYGYEHVRFIKPVRFGDTITVTYAREDELPEEKKILARVEAHNQRGEIVAAAQHILWRMEMEDERA